MIQTSHKNFAKDVLIIAFVQAFTALAGFILLPIITKTLGPYDYGIWAQITTTVSLALPFAMMGLSMSAVRFLAGEKDKEKIQEGFYSILVFVAILGIFVSIVMASLAGFLAETVLHDQNATFYISISSILVFLGALSQIGTIYFRIFRQTVTYGGLIFCQSAGQLILTIVLLSMGFGLFGVIGANIIATGLVTLIACLAIIAQIGFRIPKFIFLREYLTYSLPMMPNGIIRWITSSSDRYLIGFFLGTAIVGVYNVAYTIGSLLQMLVNPIQMVLFPELSKLFEEQNFDRIKIYLSKSVKYFSVLGIPAIFGLAILAEPIILVLSTEEFLSGAVIIPIIATAAFLGGIFQILINIALIYKITKFNFYIHISAAIVNILLNIILIPIYGIIGAAIATLISYLLTVIGGSVVCFRIFTFQIEYIQIFKSIIAAGIMAFTINLLFTPLTLTELLIAVLSGAFIYAMLIVIFRVFTEEEKNAIIEPLKKKLKDI